ncbi:aminoglycoside adenylyltransferase family protein [Streptomyces sp. NPDC050617]|uniref:aminoglycoside adenylyltransferase family protein n=1 Tax=Streptomyces sp. NPDC050617 TaxID=3154628 RepID=UPI003419EE79
MSGTGLPESEADTEAQAEDVVRLVRQVFGEDVVGAYLHGSAVLDGLRPSSDLDVLAVLRRRTTAGERRALVAALLRISGTGGTGDGGDGGGGGGEEGGGRRPVELTVVVQDDVRPWRYPPRCEFQYGEWLRTEYERGETPGPGESPDLAPLITMALLGDAPLCGPPPADALDAVPPEDLRRGIVAGVPELLAELEDDTRNVVLTLARVWRTLATGEIGSKDAAAGWALARLPEEHRPVLSRARAGYLGRLGADRERWDDLLPRLRPYAEQVTAEIERLASG